MSITKAEIIRAFDDTLSSSAIKITDDGYEVVGKYCQIIRHDDGWWDIWLIGSPRKVNALVKKLPQEWGFKTLDGEAWCWVKSVNEITKYLSCLGIKRKRRISEATRTKLKERMEEIRGVPA